MSGLSRGHATSSGSGSTAAVYNFGLSRKHHRAADEGDKGVSLSTGVTVEDQFIKWGKEVPQTQVVAHTPGALISTRAVSRNDRIASFISALLLPRVHNIG